MLGSTVVWKKSACKMTVKASTPQTHVTVTLKSQFECIEQLRTTGMQNIRETARECACTHQFAWPRHPSRKSMCLKCCSKEPGRKTQGPQQTAALTQQVDTTKRLQDRKATARRHMSEVTLNRDHGLIQMVRTSVHTHTHKNCVGGYFALWFHLITLSTGFWFSEPVAERAERVRTPSRAQTALTRMSSSRMNHTGAWPCQLRMSWKASNTNFVQSIAYRNQQDPKKKEPKISDFPGTKTA